MNFLLIIPHENSASALLRICKIISGCRGEINEVRPLAEAARGGIAHRFHISLPSSDELETLQARLRDKGFPVLEAAREESPSEGDGRHQESVSG